MKCLAAFLLLFSIMVNAAQDPKLLALQLWIAIEKQNNMSYTYLDGLRNRLPENDPVKRNLSNPEKFKKTQEILRNQFIDQVGSQFTRKEIITLIKIYKSDEYAKMRLFSGDFWDVDRINKDLQERVKK